jgi:hypothetical protein
VKSQADKGVIVDSLFFGSFAKASTVSGSDSAKGSYVYCPGPKAVLKLQENEENLADISQQLLDEKLTNINFTAIAENSGAPSETVTSLLTGVRDEIVNHVINLKKEALLNCAFGWLTLRQAGTIEWKSNTGAMQGADDFDKLPTDYPAGDRFSQTMSRASQSFNQRKQSDKFSQMSNAERSLNFMQQRQASQQRSDAKSISAAKSVAGAAS